jgi:hypothetical protein
MAGGRASGLTWIMSASLEMSERWAVHGGERQRSGGVERGRRADVNPFTRRLE